MWDYLHKRVEFQHWAVGKDVGMEYYTYKLTIGHCNGHKRMFDHSARGIGRGQEGTTGMACVDCWGGSLTLGWMSLSQGRLLVVVKRSVEMGESKKNTQGCQHTRHWAWGWVIA